MSTTLTTINPATGAALKTYPLFTKAQTEKALVKGRKTFEAWRLTNPAERAALLKSIAKALLAEKETLARLMTAEMGKPIAQSREEVEKCVRNLNHYAGEGPKMLAPELIQTDAKESMIAYQPLGLVLAVMPWNFPFWQVFRCIAPIIMAGNAMVLKHASNIAGCALAIERVMKKGGAPAGLFQTLLIPASEVADVIRHPAVSAVTFTGSTEAGKQVAATAGGEVKKQVLELGGSDAYIILEDAPMAATVKTCVAARLVNSGQSCVAAKRFVVVKDVAKQFTEKFTEAMLAATFGDPLNEGNTIGPLARTDLRDTLHKQVTDSIAKGAKLLCGGYIPEGDGAFYPPTVLANVKPGMPAYDEELFGPVASIILAKDEADAVRIANDTIYGLGGAVFTKDRKRGKRIATELMEAGSCFVNAQVHSDPRLPFGGAKQSGYGRELAAYGLREFTNVKTVFVQ